MGLLEKAKTALVKRELSAYIARLKAWVDAQQKEAHMAFWKSLGVAALGGAASAASDALINGFTLDKAGVLRLVSATFAGAFIAAAAYLKQSPLKPKGDA